MRRGPRSPDEATLASYIAETLHKRLQRDPGLQAACSGLSRLGVSVLVRVELSAGGDQPRVVIAGETSRMTQWSARDTEILHSLGIASETTDAADGPAPEPGRRQSR